MTQPWAEFEAEQLVQIQRCLTAGDTVNAALQAELLEQEWRNTVRCELCETVYLGGENECYDECAGDCDGECDDGYSRCCNEPLIPVALLGTPVAAPLPKFPSFDEAAAASGVISFAVRLGSDAAGRLVIQEMYAAPYALDPAPTDADDPFTYVELPAQDLASAHTTAYLLALATRQPS